MAFENLKTYCEFYSAKWSVPREILGAEEEIKVEFLKALFDDDGTVVPQRKNIEIRLYSINIKGLKQIQKLLLTFSIQNKIVPGYGSKRNVYGLIVKDKKLFASKIGFKCLRKQNKLNKYLNQINPSQH